MTSLQPIKQPIIGSTVLGGIITVLVFSLSYFQFMLVEKFILFAAFVVVPLVITLISNDEHKQSIQQTKLFTVIRLLQFPAALLALASVMASRTWEATNTVVPGVLSLGWSMYTLLLGIYGITMIQNRDGKISEIAIGAGLIYFFIGGVWFFLYQAQLELFQANPSTHALSSLHFHLSSAIVPMFIGMLGRIMTKKSWYPWVVAVDIIGPILISVGIMFSKPVEYIGVALFACNIAIYTTYLLIYLKKNRLHKKAACFLLLSSLGFYAIVIISMGYPLLKNKFSLTILDFIPIYGVLYAFGFVLCGLIGWEYMISSRRSMERE